MANTPPGACDQCKATGLPILPVRYTVVPKDVSPGLPSWPSGDRVKSVDIGSDFTYALRTVRTGFIYLFYEKHARGNRYWECYSVAQDGGLTIQHSTQSAEAYPNVERILCASHSGVAVGVHYLVIEQPEKCGATWIAFSQDKWSVETVKEYTTNTKLRNARMQTIHPSEMIDGAKHTHGAIATKDALEGVLEYSASVNTHALPYEGDPHSAVGIGNISQENGDYAISQLTQMSTRYPWALREKMAESMAAHMQSRAKAKGGKPGKPHVLALWDAIGITHELNGFRNDAAGWIKKYSDERELQITALNTYDGLRLALADQAQVQGEQYIRRGVSDGPLQESQRELEDKLRASPDDAYLQEQLRSVRALSEQIGAGASRIGDGFGKNLASKSWPKYRSLIDQIALDLFKGKFEEFQIVAAERIEKRTVQLVSWLEAKLLLDTLNDFHGESVEDGMLFEEAIGEAVFGIGSCKSGSRKIEEWVSQAKASIETNLLWRAVALNQNEARNELDSALAEALQHKNQQTRATELTWLGYTAKSLKVFADTYKRVQRIQDANDKVAAGTKVFGVPLRAVNMRGADKIAMTAGDAVFRHFRIDKLADYASEKIIQHIFGIRAFVSPADSVNLILAQAREDELKRADTLKRLRTARTFLAADTPAMQTAQSESVGAAWKNFRSDTSTEKKAIALAGAVKEARLALVVGLIEGVNFGKLIAEGKSDPKALFSLLASGMSIARALFDIGAVASKNLPGAGAASWSHQGLKMWGGVLSGGATLIGACLDAKDALANSERGYDLLSNIYIVKSASGGLSSGLTAAVAYTYSAPLIAHLTGRTAVGTALQAVGKRAAAFIGLRILGMAVGGWVTVGLFGLQVTVWCLTPNALEEWVDHSAFGNRRKTGGYKTGAEQDKRLQEALVEMGLK